MTPIARIPLTIEAVANGQKTGGVIVAVMVSDLDALEAENERLRAVIAAHDALREQGRCDGLLADSARDR